MLKRKTASRSLVQSLSLSVFIVGILLFTAVNVRGQGQPKVLPFFESAVVSVNGNVVQCLGGFSADLSDAEIVSKYGVRSIADIEPGVMIRVSGEPLVDPNNGVMIKAKNVSMIDLKRGFHIEGVIQSVDKKRRMIAVLNKQILIDRDTMGLKKNGRPVSLAKLKPGDDIAMDVENTVSGLVARQIVPINEDDSARAQLIGFVSAMDGAIIEIAGSFLVDISESLAVPGSVAQSIKVGSKVDLPFNDDVALNPTTPLRTGISIGLFGSSDGALLGTLLDIDLENRQITVFQKKIAITDRTFIFGPNDGKDLSSLKLGPGFRTFVIFTDLTMPIPSALIVSQSPVD